MTSRIAKNPMIKQTFVCTGRHSVYIYKENNSPFELNFFNHVDNPYSGCTLTTVNENQVWIQLRTPNRWIYSTLFPQSINVVCGTQVHAIQIQGLGELSMKNKCILDDLTINWYKVGHYVSKLW